jgi:hypothetical protein
MLRALQNVAATHLWDPRLRRDGAPGPLRIGAFASRALPVVSDIEA